MYTNIPYILHILTCCFTFTTASEYRIKVYTVASDATDGYKRFNRSARVNNISVNINAFNGSYIKMYMYMNETSWNSSLDQVETLGMGFKWRGGDMLSTGGGYKLNLLKRALDELESADETIVLFTDG